MSGLLEAITQGITFIWGLFSDLFSFMTDRPIILYAVLLPIVIAVIGIVIRVIRSFGLRPKRR